MDTASVSASAVLFTADIPVRWADLDADARVNNVQIPRYVEEARMRWAAALELKRLAPALTPVVAALTCNYHAALGYPATVRATLRCSRLGRSSLQLECELHALAPSGVDLHVANASVSWVWTETVTGKSHPMPLPLRQVCEAALPSDHCSP